MDNAITGVLKVNAFVLLVGPDSRYWLTWLRS